MKIDRPGKKVLVTGSTAGIGYAVANMVVHVASREASATNGAALRIEGGIVETIA